MKLNLTFPELESQRIRMGADLSQWRIASAALTEREALLIKLEEGIEIDLSEVDVGPGGLLSYKGEQVLLYIKDTGSSQEVLRDTPEKSRRFHLRECVTLETMRAKGRYERYVVTNKYNGWFKVDWRDWDTQQRGEMEAQLRTCKYCLKSLNYRGYPKHKKRVWESFSISEFLMEYSTFFRNLPSRTDDSAQLNSYVSNWDSISTRYREQAGWRCEQCRVVLQDESSRLLHVHHKSGVVTDNSSANLVALCALCHAKQPYHGRMKIPAADEQTIEDIRRRQGL